MTDGNGADYDVIKRLPTTELEELTQAWPRRLHTSSRPSISSLIHGGEGQPEGPIGSIVMSSKSVFLDRRHPGISVFCRIPSGYGCAETRKPQLECAWLLSGQDRTDSDNDPAPWAPAKTLLTFISFEVIWGTHNRARLSRQSRYFRYQETISTTRRQISSRWISGWIIHQLDILGIERDQSAGYLSYQRADTNVDTYRMGYLLGDIFGIHRRLF
ncbi:hypothetical protein B0H11DRAFT_1909681 [Mycena galericulata]|nr:hypothetical protein B0H11DRAFT_1909681 [Mycena galericulata]